MENVDKLLDHVRDLDQVAGGHILVFIQQSVAVFNDDLQPPDENMILQEIVCGAHLATGFT